MRQRRCGAVLPLGCAERLDGVDGSEVGVNLTRVTMIWPVVSENSSLSYSEPCLARVVILVL